MTNSGVLEWKSGSTILRFERINQISVTISRTVDSYIIYHLDEWDVRSMHIYPGK